MDEYDKMLEEQFGSLVIKIVKHDDSPTGLPAYIEANLGKKPKDLGQTALDLSNYIHRTTGLRYESMPEYRGNGKLTTLRWFMRWEHITLVQKNIWDAVQPDAPERLKNLKHHLPIAFRSLIIQDKAKGVTPGKSEL